MIKAELVERNEEDHNTSITITGKQSDIAEEFCDIVLSLLDPEIFGKETVEGLLQQIIIRNKLNVINYSVYNVASDVPTND